jgi:hypothetical protein
MHRTGTAKKTKTVGNKNKGKAANCESIGAFFKKEYLVFSHHLKKHSPAFIGNLAMHLKEEYYYDKKSSYCCLPCCLQYSLRPNKQTYWGKPSRRK